MSGSIGLSLTQRYDKTSHAPLDGGLVYFYAAGTTTPQNAYQDVSLTIPWPNPITLDSGGNVPQLFFADGYIKFRLTNAAGVTQIEADYVLVLGPSAGVGAAPSVDATTIYQTGDLKPRYGTGAHTGWVRCNRRTIGSAASGATERANADTEALFVHLYNANTSLTVSTGRGASAAADYAANKTIELPDLRGRTIAGLDDMGNTAASRLTSTSFGVATTDLGVAGGAETRTLLTVNLPAYTPAGSIAAGSATGNAGRLPVTNSSGIASSNAAGGALGQFADTAGTVRETLVVTSGAFTGTAQGGLSTPVVSLPPTLLVTIYVKI